MSICENFAWKYAEIEKKWLGKATAIASMLEGM